MTSENNNRSISIVSSSSSSLPQSSSLSSSSSSVSTITNSTTINTSSPSTATTSSSNVLSYDRPFSTYSWKVASFQQYIKNTRNGSLWRLQIHPNGFKPGHQNNISLFLQAIQTPYERQNNIPTRHQRYKLELEKIDYEGDVATDPKIIAEYQIINKDFEFGKESWGYPKFCSFDKLFPDGNRTKEIDLIFIVHFFHNEEYNKILEESVKKNFLIRNEYYFNNEIFSDIEFVLDSGNIIKAHRVIVAAGSKYFKNMLEGGWKEQNMKSIPIKNIKDETFKAILYNLYTDKIIEGLDFKVMKDIYIQADMIGLDRLQNLAQMKLVEMISEDNWDDILIFSWECGNNYLKSMVLNFIANNWENIKKNENTQKIFKTGNIEYIEELMSAVIKRKEL
nr:4141_t:CDS:2 [Entrophospora candida]